MSDWESPFKAGSRVGYRYAGFATPRECFVRIVYKNGNFVLRDDTDNQQWKPDYRLIEFGNPSAGRHWYATPTRGSGSAVVDFWDDEFDREIAREKAEIARNRRLSALRQRLASVNLHHLTDDQIAAIEAAMPPQDAQP